MKYIYQRYLYFDYIYVYILQFFSSKFVVLCKMCTLTKLNLFPKQIFTRLDGPAYVF